MNLTSCQVYFYWVVSTWLPSLINGLTHTVLSHHRNLPMHACSKIKI